MKKIFFIILLLLFLSGCSADQDRIESVSEKIEKVDVAESIQDDLKNDSCDELGKRFSKEKENLDLSCESDADCVPSTFSSCGCKKAGTDTMALEEIFNAQIEKDCIPQAECQEYDCQCKSGECAAQVVKR